MKRKDKEFARDLASYASTTPELIGNFETLLDAPIYENPNLRPMVKYNPTNADRIRAMSDEELAMFMAERYAHESFMRLKDDGYEPTETARCALTHNLYIIWLTYLKQPVDNPELGGDT